MVADAVVCGPAVDWHVAQLQRYLRAGFDDVYICQIGPDAEGFFRFYAEHVLPRVR
jgi:hypothetical protein